MTRPKQSSSKPRATGSASPSKRSKYGNKKCEIGGEKYRSKREANRHQALLLLERAGLLENLRREVPFVLAPAVRINGRGRPALRYFADFVYVQGGVEIVEDAKGVRTEGYRIKRHLMLSVHGISILET